MYKQCVLALSLLGMCIAANMPSPAYAIGSPESLTVKMFMEEITKSVNEMIEKARQTGDYMTARVGAEMLNSIDAWEKSNKSILNDAFKGLDKESRETFARAHSLVNTASVEFGSHLDELQQISVTANQIIESIPTNGRQAYILHFSPRIQPPNASDKFTVRIRGVNLGNADPTLRLDNGPAQRLQPSQLEAQLIVPVKDTAEPLRTMEIDSYELSYKTPQDSLIGRWFGDPVQVNRTIPIVRLPDIIADLDFAVKREFKKRETKTHRDRLEQFKGRNERVYRMVKPPEGWLWDLAQGKQAFSHEQHHGKKGTCGGIDLNASTKQAVQFHAHVDERGIWPDKHPGYVNCTIIGPVYRDVPVKETISLTPEQLTWTETLEIPLPEHTTEVYVRAQTFDNRAPKFVNTGHDPYFDIRVEGETLIVAPKIPEDISM